MKNLSALICSLAALTFSTITHATPVQYQVTATYSTEYYINGGHAVSALYSLGTTISANFFYDAATPATSINNPNSITGPYSYYTQAATDFSGNILGQIFHASNADVAVHDYDIVAIGTGEVAYNSATQNSNFQGFTVGEFTLIGAAFSIMGADDMLPDQSIPSSLHDLNSFNTLMLYFKNYDGNMRWTLFTDASITPAPVPLPSSALFFLSGLIGLGANAVRKLKR